MPKKDKGQRMLIQTLVDKETHDWVVLQADFDGISASAWLRRLVLHTRQIRLTGSALGPTLRENWLRLAMIALEHAGLGSHDQANVLAFVSSIIDNYPPEARRDPNES